MDKRIWKWLTALAGVAMVAVLAKYVYDGYMGSFMDFDDYDEDFFENEETSPPGAKEDDFAE